MARVLLVDDNSGVLRFMALVLRLAGYECEGFEHPTAALKAFARNPETYRLLVTDITMPGLLGTELAARILEIRPNMPVVFVTGYTHEPDLPHPDLLSRFPVLRKPEQIPVLRVTVGRMLRSAEKVDAASAEAHPIETGNPRLDRMRHRVKGPPAG